MDRLMKRLVASTLGAIGMMFSAGAVEFNVDGFGASLNGWRKTDQNSGFVPNKASSTSRIYAPKQPIPCGFVSAGCHVLTRWSVQTVR